MIGKIGHPGSRVNLPKEAAIRLNALPAATVAEGMAAEDVDFIDFEDADVEVKSGSNHREVGVKSTAG